ncbi:cobalamin-dependent protein, partial [bacterium]|nr:cobalamin-dependent protein [bacterium]
MEKIDCLFINTPKMNGYYKPLGDFILDTYMPMGLLAMANLLTKEGFSSKIIHLGVEWVMDHDFSILDYLRNREITIIAIPLHWHHQSYDSIELARKIKEAYPKVYIVLGGYTASYFDE